MLSNLRSSLLCVAILSPLAGASTWVVGPSPGAGIDFTSISSAIAASQPGDVIRVRAGIYTSFSLSLGLSILCDAGVHVGPPTGGVTIFDVDSIPAGQRVVISGMDFFYYPARVTNCVGPVLLDALSSSSLEGSIVVTGCTDVRLRNCTAVSVVADASRVEITGSTLRGRDGFPGCAPPCVGNPQGEPGVTGLVCTNGATVRISSTSITGGTGGDGDALSFCPNFAGGNGGHGILVESGDVLITGTGSQVIAGAPGGSGQAHPSCPPAASGANGLAIWNRGGVVQHSGVQFQGSVFGASAVVPADPVLTASIGGVSGTQLVYTVFGQPGDTARLRLGRRMIVEDVPFVFEDRLTVALRSYLLGQLPASGQLTFTLNVPGSLPPGFVLVAQASTTTPLAETRLTQSVPFAIR